MPQHVWNVEWLNANANRSYPLDDSATGLDVSGGFEIPKSFLLDLMWPVHAAFDQPYDRFHITSLVTTGTLVACGIGYTDTSGIVREVGSFRAELATHVPGAAYRITGAGDYADSVGSAALGDLGSLNFQGGAFAFSLAGARIAPTCIRPALRGVSSLRVRNGADLSDPLTGDVVLTAGTNIRLSVDPDTNSIRVDAIAGEGLGPQCDCEAVAGIPIRTINNIPPDIDGNFTLAGDECFVLTPMSAGIQFSDKCSSACCGCDELRVVVEAAESLEERIVRLERAGEELRQAITQMDLAILASRVDSTNCGG